VLGSTRGTSLQPVIDAIEAHQLNAVIVMIISNKDDAGILQRGVKHHIPTLYINSTKKSREVYDHEVSTHFKAVGTDLILMIGYMRIVSKVFTDVWMNKCMNVHPSLLPEFAGGMDLQVHEAVLKAKKNVTGCTIHFVTDTVDGGPIVCQETCPIDLENDTPEILKSRVQLLEGMAFIKAIDKFQHNFGGSNGIGMLKLLDRKSVV
jgi:formyltetrahydrofolate-dependent phosphoribosylglycinamide formyltransferase